MKRIALVLLSTAVLVVGMAGVGQAKRRGDPPCTISPNPAAVGQTYVVSASGIPTGTAINLWVTDPSGNTTGSPLGGTPDGTFNLNESSSSAGTWTYAFSGPVRNNNTTVYESCSVEAY
jgi:hypothetical protein